MKDLLRTVLIVFIVCGVAAGSLSFVYGSTKAFLAQFAGKAGEQLALKKDNPTGAIDAITAATISSRAVSDTVRAAAESGEN